VCLHNPLLSLALKTWCLFKGLCLCWLGFVTFSLSNHLKASAPKQGGSCENGFGLKICQYMCATASSSLRCTVSYKARHEVDDTRHIKPVLAEPGQKLRSCQVCVCCRMPFVFLELKGAAFNTDAIDWLWAEVLELGIVNHVALYVTDDTQPGMLAQQTHWQGLLIRGFRVSVHCCPTVALKLRNWSTDWQSCSLQTAVLSVCCSLVLLSVLAPFLQVHLQAAWQCICHLDTTQHFSH